MWMAFDGGLGVREKELKLDIEFTGECSCLELDPARMGGLG